MSSAITPRLDNTADREVTRAWKFFAGTFVAMILEGIWTIVTGTASFGADEAELVRGWEGVLRNLPGYLLFVAVPLAGVWFAAQAGVHGAQRAPNALIATSLALLFALGSVTRDAAEIVMTTRSATVAWQLFGVDVLVVGALFLVAKSRIRNASGR